MSTSCRNTECPEHPKCNFNIHNGGLRPCTGDHRYMSAKQGIWKEYTEKCKRDGKEPMPYNIYFEH